MPISNWGYQDGAGDVGSSVASLALVVGQLEFAGLRRLRFTVKVSTVAALAVASRSDDAVTAAGQRVRWCVRCDGTG